MSDEPRKRSRFDQTEQEAKRPSRFDRRSRSPSAKQSEGRRSRSPLDRSSGTPDAAKRNPAAAAAAAAARINAQLEAKRGIQHVDVPPIRSVRLDGLDENQKSARIDPAHQNSTTVASVKSPVTESSLDGDIYQQDGDYIKDIEVNDLRNRYTLTKGATQKMIKDETGADVTTRGNYYPDKSMATAANPPLYLHVTSQSKEGLEKAIAKIEELMQQTLPVLVDERRFRRPREPEQVERDEQGRRKWPEERIPIDLEPIPGFNLRAQVVGHGGAYVKHIQNETRCRVQIKGRGSGFYEHSTGVESDEPMYLHVAGPDPAEVKHARELCEDLLSNVKEQYQAHKDRGGQRGFHSGGDRGDRGDRGGYGGRGDRGAYQGDSYPGGGYQQPDNYASAGYGAQSPTASGAYAGAGTPSTAAGADDYAAQYAQYYAAQAAAANGGQDPYAAYGGYEAYVRMYYQYYGQQADGQQQPGGAPGAEAAPGAAQGYEQPPPPPPGTGGAANEQPPPPPPPGAGSPPGTSGGYGAVPPPPGM